VAERKVLKLLPLDGGGGVGVKDISGLLPLPQPLPPREGSFRSAIIYKFDVSPTDL